MSDDTASVPAWISRVTNLSGAVDTGKAGSWLRCSVEGRSRVAVHLTSILPAAEHTALTASRPEYGPFYCEIGPLKAGRYTLTVDGLDVVVPLWLDGRASAAVAFAPAPLPALGAGHVLLLGQMMGSQANFLALTRYVARFQAVVTFAPGEAMQAEHVILIGSPQLVSQAVEQQLRDAGVRVERAQGDIAGLLDRAVAAGVPFIEA